MPENLNRTKLKIANAIKNWGSLQGNARITMQQAFVYLDIIMNYDNLKFMMDSWTEATDNWARMRGVHPNVFGTKDDHHIADICISTVYSECYEVDNDPGKEVSLDP